MIPVRRVSSLIFLVGVSVWSVCYQASCSSPVKPPDGKPASAPTGQVNFYVNFNGPWAFMQDPDDPAKIVAVAPFIADHESAYAAAINETPIINGIYEVTGPPSSPMTVDPQLVVVKDSISKAQFSDVATNAGSARYMIRLPMPSDLTAYRIG